MSIKEQAAQPSLNPVNDLRPDVTDSTEGASSYETMKQVYTAMIKDIYAPLRNRASSHFMVQAGLCIHEIGRADNRRQQDNSD